MKTEGALQYLQKLNTETYAKPDETNPHPHILLLCCAIYYYPPIYISFSEEILSVFRLNFFSHFSSLMSATWPAHRILFPLTTII